MMTKNVEEEKKPWSYKDWYEKHRLELSEKRRQRYQEDPEYKKKVLAQNQAYRARKAKEEAERPRARVRAQKQRRPILMEVRIHGQPTTKEMVHVGAFARAIERSVPTVHQWERLGLLPRTPFLLTGKSKQERLYTQEMIDAVLRAMEARNGVISASDKSFAADIREAWLSAGIEVPYKNGENNS
jgi:hypothetical protein